jgi:hypothetical protein
MGAARCLTLPSRGRHPASRAPPLMSNVGHHGRFAMLSPLLSLRYKSQCRGVCVTSRRKSQGPEALYVPLPFASHWCRVATTKALRCKRPLMVSPAHSGWPVAFIAPSRPAVRSGSACPWLALRAAVLRLAVSPLRAADFGGGCQVSAGTLRPVLGIPRRAA